MRALLAYLVASACALAPAPRRAAPARAATLADAPAEPTTALPRSAFDAIRDGRVAVVRDWLPPAEVAALRADARGLLGEGRFVADMLTDRTDLAGDPAHDRMVLRKGPWHDFALGDGRARARLAARLADARAQLAAGLARPGLLAAGAERLHEVSYSRFGPGAYLAGHVDEPFHGALAPIRDPRADGAARARALRAAAAGLAAVDPSRERAAQFEFRSVTFILYLNDAWDARAEGGELMCFEQPLVAGGGGARASASEPRHVAPEGGTIVLFDSLIVPHEVLPTRTRERFACSGWFWEVVDLPDGGASGASD